MSRPLAESCNVASALDWASACLQTAGVEAPRRDARILLTEVLGGDPAVVIGYPERPLDGAESARFGSLVRRRAAREPVSRIVGRREFWSLPFFVTPDTLDPRPESETLVEAVLARIRDRAAPMTILDLGTGSGCLLLALLAELPQATGLGIDLSKAAVAVAWRNAESLDLMHRAGFRQGDWASGLIDSWQVIVSNPPYIIDDDIADLAPEVACYDPRMALSGGPDGLAAYRSLIPQAAKLLAPGGTLALEVGAGQAEDVGRLLHVAGLVSPGHVNDLSGTARCVLAKSKL
jgi:release factor glutamine methyltransferase